MHMQSTDLAAPEAQVAAGTTSRLSTIRRTLGAEWRHNGIAYLFILPAVTLCFLFMAYPLVQTIIISFYKWDGIRPRVFVGWSNFESLLSTPSFYQAVRNTFLFTVTTTAAKVFLGFMLAAALHTEVRGWKVFRAIFYLNVILPMTAVAILWGAILNPNGGMVDAVLQLFGQRIPSVLGNAKVVMWALCLIDIWKNAGFTMIFFYAAMEGIPRELYEAASLEGLGPARRLYHITLPLIKPVVLTMTMLQLIFSFKAFDLVFAMTKGGPGTASTVLTFFLYREGFWFLRFGTASAAGVVLLIAVLMFSFFYMRRGGVGSQEFEY
jgi:multiple sugar transport system permease protein